MAVLDAAALREVDAERRAEQRRLDVVRGQRVAGEQHVDEAGLDQRDHRRRRAGVHDRRAADPEDLVALGLDLAHAAAAIWRTSSACGFSLDTVEDMNSKPARRRCARRQRQHDLHAARAADDLVAGLARRLTGIVCTRAAARRRARSPSPAARPAPSGRRAARRSRGWWSSRSRPGTRRPRGAGCRSASTGVDRVDPVGLQPMRIRCSVVGVVGADRDPRVRLVVVRRGRGRAGRPCSRRRTPGRRRAPGPGRRCPSGGR